MSKTKIGVIQATPVLFDLEKSIEKVRQLVRKYARKGCEYLLFPESFLPGYPRGLSFDTVVGRRGEKGRKLWLKYYHYCIQVPGHHSRILGEIAKESRVFLFIGVSEKDTVNGSLYCTLLYFAPNGDLIGKHRKIKPTGTERLIWAEGNAETLTTIETSFGKIGGLICWENYMPLARMALYQKGIDIYLAPTADARDTWISSLKHIACEGRCYVLGCNQFVKRSDYPEELQQEITKEPEIMCRGGSIIVSPMGEIIEGPLYDQEGVLIAELDTDEIIKSKMDFDVIGHYAREDLFHFEVEDIPDTIKVDH